jgi:putative FmdB family regulatory protein
MPIYEYSCQDCGQIFEEWQSNFEERELQCPICGGTSKRLISNTSFVLKGSGWYVTDYAGKNASTSGDNGNGNGNGSGGSSEAKSDSSKESSSSASEASGASKSADAAS